jgi:hypothetical protein
LFEAAVTELDLLTDELEDLLGIFAFHRNLLVIPMGRLNLVDTFIIQALMVPVGQFQMIQ